MQRGKESNPILIFLINFRSILCTCLQYCLTVNLLYNDSYHMYGKAPHEYKLITTIWALAKDAIFTSSRQINSLFQQWASERGFPAGSDGKEYTCNVGNQCSILYEDPLEKGMATQLQHSCLEISMDKAWWARVRGVSKSWTQLSD